MVELLEDQEIKRIIQQVTNEWGGKSSRSGPARRSGSELPAPDESVDDHRVSRLETVRSLPASGFERLCQRLLREAGFQEVKVTGPRATTESMESGSSS